MKKIYISCCAECPAHVLRMSRIPFCAKKSMRIDEDSEKDVNPALIGFPDWCPLETAGTDGKVQADYKKEVKRIMKIMSDDLNPDAIAEASHYLNSVVENAKKKTETD